MNAVFTIVSKNYLSLAKSLEYSINNNNSCPVNFYIFLADNPDGLVDLSTEEYKNVILAAELKLDNILDLAFKYNVTEFCTAIKPSCFKYIFEVIKADKAIYFDPDIYVFNDLDCIFLSDLMYKDIVVTPHYLSKQINYTGDQKETTTLFVGIYNFGFVAFNNTVENKQLLDWWEARLFESCYADKEDALHTDQKWGDFFPVYAGERLLISKSMGYNLAPWNLFEREIIKTEVGIEVQNRLSKTVKEKLIFVHFAGFDPTDLNLIHKDFPNLSINKYEDYNIVRSIYVNIVNKFNFLEKRTIPYSYSTFSNSIYIQEQHRRIYRACIENNIIITEPFSEDGDFYGLLNKKGLIIYDKPVKLNKRAVLNFRSKVNKLNFFFKFFHKILGTQKYFLLMKFLNRYSRFENQVFLIDTKIEKIY